MKISSTPFQNLVTLSANIITDERGYFCEAWNLRNLALEEVDLNFVQENVSYNRNVGVLRGLHCQAPKHAQAKLIRCCKGHIFDVAVDIRTGSPSFGKWFGIDLTEENNIQLLVPIGFLHGYVTRSSESEVIYCCSDYYNADSEIAVNFADTSINIDWGLPLSQVIVSEKDRKAQPFSSFESPFQYMGST